MIEHRIPRRALVRRIVASLALAILLAGLGLAAPALHLVDTQPMRLFDDGTSRPDVAAVFFSGDMGLVRGVGPKIARALAAQGVPVVGVSSVVMFSSHRTRGEADAIVANAIRTALARTGASRTALIGQSFGADIIATTAPDLPPDLRPRIASVTLVVPSQTVFFRADPTGLTYLGTPDARPAAALHQLSWAPVTCIYAVEERDSLCSTLADTPARRIGLPGGHFLQKNDRLIVATMVEALHPPLLSRRIEMTHG